MMLAPVNSLWIGSSLGPVERACLRSFLRLGHPVRLFTYDKIDGIPEGVERVDAREILPKHAILRYKNGSYALFANYFRVKLQALDLGYWVDTDVYAVKPFEFSEQIVFGWEDCNPRCINNAILRIPAKSRLTAVLLSIFEGRSLAQLLPFRERLGFMLEERKYAQWPPLRERISLVLQKSFSRKAILQDLPWSTTGPYALTHYARAFGLAEYALPQETFYPIPCGSALWITDPIIPFERALKPATHAVHLWNQYIKEIKSKPGQQGSFLARLQREGA